MRYHCRDCGRVFLSPIRVEEKHGLDAPPYETYSACPNCFGWDYVPYILCDACGGEIEDSYVHVPQKCFELKEIV